ncbi:hypothetical protein ULF88_01315 [Halopseudomonas pachastrellae]|nr:hypothetical protein [Halopseudomonas pachastrellae]
MIALLPFLVFAFVASITPGPTNLLAMSSSARFGMRASLPLSSAAVLHQRGWSWPWGWAPAQRCSPARRSPSYWVGLAHYG